MEKYKERVEIGCYTKMSEMLGISSVKEYIDEAINRNWCAIGITDLDSTQSFIEAQEYIEKNQIKNLKLIYGVKTRFIDDNSKDENEINEIIILVKEQKGLKNLYTLLSNENIIFRSQLDKYREGLLYGTYGINGEVYKKIYDKNESEELNKIVKYYDFIQIEPVYNAKKKVRGDYITKIRNIDETSKIQEINKKIIELGNNNNILVIASSNPLFIKKEDSICNEILNHSKGIIDCECNNERYLHTTEELLEKFNYLDKEMAIKIVTDNTHRIVEMCEEVKPINIEKLKKDYPKIENSKNIIKDECYKKAHDIYGKELQKNISDRLELELSSIIENEFETIYLMASDAVKKSNELGYLVGYRGSIGNSFVAFLLGITECNPIDYNLPFEIFAGKNFDSEPDIDLNFSNEIVNEIHEYISEKYGKSNVIHCGTIGAIAEKTAKQMIEKYSEDLNYEIEEKKKHELVDKLIGIKRCTGVHPGGIFILPEGRDIKEFTPVESYKVNDKSIIKTHMDYHSIWQSGLYKFDILSHDTLTILHRLKEITQINPKDIDLNDKETLSIFVNAGNEKYEISTRGIPEFGTKFVINMLKESKPKNFNDLICIDGLAHGSGTWTWNAEWLIKNKCISINKVISNRADIMNFLISNGIKRETAFEIEEFVRKGKAHRKCSKESRKEILEQWNEYKEIMKKNNIPEWYIESCENIQYLFPKAHAIGYTINAFRIAWYKVHYPKAFYKVYFEIKGNIDINKYNCKKQVERKIKQLENLDESEEISKYNEEIYELKLLLEMYNRGIKEDIKREADDYDLINSRAIGDYCRQIEHKFNIEELAVLVYRNKRMDIDEKIVKYKDLIDNYPDMEVIKRINCNHYDNVKDMIKNEIERLNVLKNKLVKKEEGVIYSYDQYYTSIRKWDRSCNYLENLRTTFEDIDKEIAEYIEEYNDTLKYNVSKRYLNSDEPTITAEYQVINNKRILTNIYDSKNNFLDIDNIFVNIPTPFKKGDLLVSWDDIPYREGLCINNKDVFVLDYLCTWRKGLNEYLAEGNYDSSDMVGYGYYMYDDSDEFICDDKWNYDNFEYYEGELKGIYRTLKAISSLMKNKIELELFVQAYEKFKIENRISLIDWYTEDALKLAGCSESDIARYKDDHERRIYNMSEDEKMN